MMSDQRRRRSPESSRRRRKARRDSREQLVAEAAATSGMPLPGPSAYQPEPTIMRHDPSIAARSRKYSSSDLSSSSSSYLDISRRYPKSKRYGGIFKSFFSTPSEHKHHYKRKKKRRVFGFGNSSSSSVNSDLAYGTGFIKKSKSRGALSPQETVHGPAYTEGRRSQPTREKTDEEIIEIGRKLAKIARDQNAQDLAAQGRRKPTSFETTVSGFDKFRRQNTGDSLSRGIGASRPHGGDSSPDDSEWESASEDEFSDDADSGLAYGASASALSLIANKPQRKPSQIVSQKPPEEIRPPDRKSSVVDPKMFGPVNSLRGYVQTPCGFDKEQPPVPNKRYSGSMAPITPVDSASIEARPLQTVYAVPTSDPRRFDVSRGSGSSSRPDPVPIQAPKPIAPVPQRLYEEDRIKDLDRRDSKSSRRQSDGKSFAETAAVGAGVAAGIAMIADHKDKRDDRDSERRDREREREKRRQRELELEREIARREAELREREERYAREKESHRRSKRDSNVKIIDERDQKRSSRDDRRDDRSDKRSETDKRSERRDADVDVEYEREREKRRREREKRRDEPTSGHDRDKRRIKDDRKDDHRESRKEERQDARRVSQPSEQPALEYRRVEDPNLPASKAPIDPFQFQVDDDAFQTPLFSTTPMRPLTPQVVTVEREPNFSRFDDTSVDDGRKSRRDSFEDEMRDAKHIYDETSHATAPIDAAAMAAAVAAVERERREHKRGRDPEPRSPKDTSQKEDAQAEADRYYAELRTARRIAEEQIRSRSNSPDKSVVEKYNKDEPEEPIIRIVTPPEMEHKDKNKSKYDGPNADVRIDNVIVPKDLPKFQQPPISPEGPHLPVVLFKSRDPSAERERPLLNLVLPTPAPTPTPEKQKKAPAVVEQESTRKEPQPESEKEQTRDISIGPRGEIIESPSTPKSVTWGKNETKRYYPESPEHSRERSPDDHESKVVEVAKSPRPAKKSGGWGMIAAAIVGAGGAAAAASDDDVGPKNELRESEIETVKPVDSEQQGSPKQRTVLPKGTTPKALDEEPADLPPAPGPKPASPRSSQMPGAFADDLDFAARLAGGLEKSGFDPNIVIDNDTYRRRDSPPGSNDDYPLYKQPFAETVTDLGVYGADGTSKSKSAPQHDFDQGKDAATQDKEEKRPLDDIDIPSKTSKKERRKQEKASRRRSGDDYKEIEVIEEPEEVMKSIHEPEAEPTFEPLKLSKKEQRKRDKAAKAAQWADDEPAALTQEPESIAPIIAGEDEWAETSSKKSKKSKKSKRSSSNWDDEEATPTDDRRISVPVDAFKDLQDDKAANPDEEWDTPKKSKKKSKRDSVTYDSPSRSESIAPSETSTGSSRDKSKKSSRRKSGQDYESSSKNYDIPEDEPPDKRERKRDSYRPIDRDVSSVVSDPAARYDDRYDSKSVASRDDDEEMGSVVSAPTGSDLRRKSSKSDKRSSKEEKRSSGSFFGLFGKSNGTEDKEKESSKSSKDGKKDQSFLDNAGTLGAGAGLAGAVTAYLSRSNATDAPLEKDTSDIDLEPTQKQTVLSREVDIVDPEIVQRIIKPAIDPQYGDLLPLPPSEPGSPHWETVEEALPALPDSRPNTPPEHERALLRDKLHTHVRRRSAYETPVKSPSHTAIPIQFRIGQRSVPSSPGVIRSSPIPSMPSPSTPAIELGSVPQKRLSRPTSWDSSREIKPLYLLEQTGRSSSSHLPDDDLDSMDLPPLPPSRESPGPEYEVKQDDVEYFRLAPSERDAPLHIDTSVGSVAQPGDHLGSQDSTPKAEKAPPLELPLDTHTLGSESEDTFEDAEEHIQRSMSPSPTPHEEIADDLPTLPRQTHENEQALTSPETGRPWDALDSQGTPVPVDPVSKDRSSYLLRSTPRSTGGDIIERSSPPSPSPKAVVEPKLSHDNLVLEAALGVAAGGLIAAAMLHGDDSRSQGTSTPVQASQVGESNKALSSLPEKVPAQSAEPQLAKEVDLSSEAPISAGIDDDLPWTESEAAELSYTPAKKGKKGKKARKSQLEEFEPSFSSRSEDLADPLSIVSQEFQSVEAPVEDWAIPKSSKKNKKKKSQFEDWESQSDVLQAQDPPTGVDNVPAAGSLSEDVQEPAKDEGFQVTPSLERSSSMSKKGKKKKGKKFTTWEPEEEPTQSEPSNQSVSEEVSQIMTEVEQKPRESSLDFSSNALDNSAIPDDFAPAMSKNDRKKKKGKKAKVWEPESEVSQQPSRTLTPEPIKDVLETDLSSAGTGEASRDMDLAPEQLPRPEGAVRGGESELDELPTSSKPTPAGGPGAWLPTPATGESKPSETDYFPSAPTVHRPSVSEASPVDEKKGYFPSALSMLPIAAPLAAVGSLFGRGKRDKKDSESGDIDSEGVTGQPSVQRTLDESQIAPVRSIHSSDQLPASPTTNVLVEPSGVSADMAPGGSLSEDKSVGDTPSSAVGTTDLLPDQRPTAPEATERSVAEHQPPQPISSESIVHEERPVSPTPRDIHVDDILPVPIPSGEDESSMEPIIEEPSNVADDQPISSVDWEQETGSRKKGKKGKKNRRSIPNASQLPIASESRLPLSKEYFEHNLARDEPSWTSAEEPPSLSSTDAAVDIAALESSAVEASPSIKPGKKSLKKSKKRMDSAQLVPWEDDIPRDIDDALKSVETLAESSEPSGLERAGTPVEGDSQGPGTPPSGKKFKKEKKRLRASRTMSLSDDMATDSADDPSTRAASIDTENLNWDDLKPSRLTVFSDVGVNDEDQSEADWDVPRKGKKGKQSQQSQHAADDSAALSESAQSGQISKESTGESAAQDTESQGLEEFQFTPKKGKSSKKKKRQSVTWADSRDESPFGTSRLATEDLPQPEVKELSPISPVRKDILFPEVEGGQDQSATSGEPSSALDQDIGSIIPPVVTIEAPTPTPTLHLMEESEQPLPSQASVPIEVPETFQAASVDEEAQDASILPEPSLGRDIITPEAPESASAMAPGDLTQDPVILPAGGSSVLDAPTSKSLPSESILPSSEEPFRGISLQDQPEHSTAVAEDEFPMTIKKSKKDKKKRKSKVQDEFEAPLQEPLEEEPIIEPPPQEHMEEMPVQSSAIIEESIQPSLTSEPESMALQPEQPAIEQEPAAEDEFSWAPTTKKSKKDKKKRKSKIQDDFDTPSGTLTPADETISLPVPSDELPSTSTEAPAMSQEETAPEPAQITEQMSTIDDDFSWAPTTKKSKKDKKKGKSKVQDDFFDAPSEMETPEESTSGPPLPSQEPISGLKEGATTNQEETSTSRDISQTQDIAVPVNLNLESEQVTEPEVTVDDDFSWAPTGKKSKKDKKKRKSKVQEDFFDSPSETATPVEEPKTHTELSQDLAQSSEAPVVIEEPVASTRDIGETIQVESFPINSSLESEQLPVEQEEPAIGDEFSWMPTTKKSKKDKKRKSKILDDLDASSGLVTPVEESSIPPLSSQDLEESTEAPIISKDPVPIGEMGQEEVPPISSASEPEKIVEQEPVAEDEFSWAPTKKSKKDKKKRKSKLQDDFDSVSGTATPVQEESSIPIPPLEVSSEEQPTLPQEPLSLSSDILTEEPQQVLEEPEPVVEEESSEFFVSKKSKKDKKKKSLTLDLDVSDVLSADSSDLTETSTPVILPQEEPSVSTAEQSKDDDFSSFSTSKKSKKDKKKKRASVTWAEPETESGSQTPAVDELPESSEAIEDLVVPTEISEEKTGDILPSSTSTESLSKPELESKVDDGDDTLIVAGGAIPEQSISKPELEAKIDDGDDTIIVAGGALPEQLEKLPSQLEPIITERDIVPPLAEGDVARIVNEPTNTVSDEVKPSDDTSAPLSSQNVDERLSEDLVSPSVPQEDAFATPGESIPGLTEEPMSLETSLSSREEQQSDDPSGFFTTKKSKKDKKKKRASQVQEFEPESTSLPETPFEPLVEDSQQSSLEKTESALLAVDGPTQEVSGMAEEGYFEALPGKKSKKDKKKAKKLAQQYWDDVESPVTEEQKDNITNDEMATQDQPQGLSNVESTQTLSLDQSNDTPLDQEASQPKEADADFFPSITRKLSKKEKKKAQKLAQQSWDEPEPDLSESRDVQGTSTGDIGLPSEEKSIEKSEIEVAETFPRDLAGEITRKAEEGMVNEPEEEFQPTLSRKMSKKEKRKAEKLGQSTDDIEQAVDERKVPTSLDTQTESLQTEEMQSTVPETQELDLSHEASQILEGPLSQEPEIDDFAPITRKMSKKEKRKSQKSALSEPEADVTKSSSLDKSLIGSEAIPDQTTVEEYSQEVSEPAEPLSQPDATLDVSLTSPSRDDQLQDDEFPGITKKMSKKDKKKAKKQAQSSWEPEPVPLEEQEPVASETGAIPLGKDVEDPTIAVSEREVEQTVSLEPQTKESEEPVTEDWPMMTRKMSKKDKKKAKKQAQSWQDTEVESSNTPASLPSETPVAKDLPQDVIEAPLDDFHQSKELDIAPEAVPEETEPPVAKEAEADDDFGFSISRKKSKKDKMRKGSKQSDSEPASGTQTPAIQESTLSSVAEVVDSSSQPPLDFGEATTERDVDSVANENTAEPADVFPESKKKPKKDKKRRKSSALNVDQTMDPIPSSEALEESSESNLTATVEKDVSPDKQQDAIVTTASTDIWANDDYFKPRPSDEKAVLPAEPPFDHVEIHPVVARELGASPDKGITAAASERPLVGLGLIARHSSIFNENEGYAPKLLTMTSETPSTEARDTPRFQSPDVITHTENPEATVPTYMGAVDLTPAQERSSISHEPPFDLSGPEKRVKTKEADDMSIPKQAQPSSSADQASSRDVGLSSREIAAEYLEKGHEKGHESSPSRSDKKEVHDVHPEPQETNLSAHEIAASFLDRQSPKSLPGHGPASKDEAASAREIAALYLEHEHDLKKSDTVHTPSAEDESSKADVAAAAGALTGGVALLAQKFGGTKKTKGKKKGKSKYVDKRTPQEDDMFDDPSLWEGADRKPMEGSRMDADTATFWDVPSEDPAKKSHVPVEDIEARDEQHEPVTKTRDILGESEVVESPILGRGTSEGAMIVERSTSPTLEVKGSDIDRVSTSSPPGGVAMDLDKHEEKEVRTLPTPRSPSPPPHQPESVMIEEPVLRSIEPADDEPARAFTPTVDFGRSLSRGLPPVQEEPTEEVEAERHDTTLREQPRRLLATPDVNRDSGFMADSPIPRQRSYYEDGQIRDSGVHLRDFPESSPRQSTRGFSPEPTKLSRSSADVSHHDTPKPEEKRPKKAPLGESESRRQFREGTLVLREPPELPHTPEPRKAGTDKQPRPKQKYPELSPASSGGAALAAGAAVAAGQRSVSDNISANQRVSPQPPNFPRRSASNTSISRMRTPEPLNLRPDSPGIIRHSATPPLRSKRVSGDLRSLSQRSQTDLALSAPTSKPATPAGEAPDLSRAAQINTPVANEGRVRTKDMTDVYDGFGEGRIGSPRSPTRPHSMRRRQSMQVLELESKVEQLIAENRLLSDARAQAEQHLSNRATSVLAERDAEIDTLKQSIDFLRKEVDRLTEVNEGLSSANATIAIQHNDRYRQLETQHADAARELEQARGAHGSYSQLLQEKDAEIESLRAELESAKDKIREMQRQILEQNPVDAEFLNIKDVDHFDHRCQQLCSHVQQWVLRFSKFSDMRACRLTNEINDEKIIDRLDNAVLDGSDVDHYLNDRVKRRDIFMSMTMTMIWEFVFTRYLFGMDREQRQKLKSLEKLLLEVGPPQAVRQWRAVTLTLLSRRDAFKDQRDQDTEAVVQAIFQTLSMILPPPSNLEDQIQTQLRRVMREAVDLAIEMRTQRAEYMMLPPLQPDYDANGDLAETVHFNASLMNERSGDNISNEELEAQGSIVRVVLFPLVVKKGDDNGVGDDEIVVSPAQVLIAKSSSSRRSIRMVTPSSDAGGVSLLRGGSPSTAPNRSNVSMAQPEAEYLEGGI